MNDTVSGKTAIVGVGESRYYKRGGSPDSEFKLACQAILAAVEDAGLRVTDIDGFTSFSGERNDAMRLANALGIPELRFAGLAWIAGHAGAALTLAAAAVASGYANYVVTFRALAQGQFGRFGQFGGYGGSTGSAPEVAWPISHLAPYGFMAPGQTLGAIRTTRYMHDHNVGRDTLRAISMACYHHAQNNPNAVMYGRPLSVEDYENSRMIAEPLRLFDYCLENDGAAAVIVTTRERARDLKQKPAYILGVVQGSDERQLAPSLNNPMYATSNYTSVGRRLYEMAQVDPKDIDVCQLYDNFTGGVLMSIPELGFCQPEELDELCQFENLIAPAGKFPINTSGGNIAECYTHGMELVNEAVRQVRGTSLNQVPNVELSLFTSATLAGITGAGILSVA